MEHFITILGALIALWFIFVLPMQMAKARGRSELGWLFVSLFFSPFIAIIGLALLGDAS